MAGVFCSAGWRAPRERIRPKDARRECARDLTVAAMVFGLESTLSMVGRAERERCSRSRVEVERAGAETAATSGLRWWAYGNRVGARGLGEEESEASGGGGVVSGGGMLAAEGGMRALVRWWAAGDDEEDGIGNRYSSSGGSWSTAAKLGWPGFVHWCGQTRADRFEYPPARASNLRERQRRRQRSRRGNNHPCAAPPTVTPKASRTRAQAGRRA